ncbi:MAG: hypothetical protein GF384_08130 [Elusimicrobia bacterium]|nr:hypothetical protein [Elusimicrobiota bacterium]MBD3412600.1 hypothetical protein [Elusimicrobiota bacterium]
MNSVHVCVRLVRRALLMGMIGITVLTVCGHAKRYIRLVKIKEHSGTVKIWRDREKQWENAQPEMHFYPHDQIMTQSHSTVVIYFQDKSEIQINPESIVQFDELIIDKSTTTVISSRQTLLSVWAGHIKAWISPLGTHDQFNVRTPTALCAVRGTNFTMDVSDEAETFIQVYEGSVGVTDPEKIYAEKIVNPGEQIRVVRDMPIPDPEPLELLPETEPEPDFPEPEKSSESEFIPNDEDVPIPPIFSPEEEPSQPEQPAVPAQAPAGGIGTLSFGRWITFTMNGALGATVITDPVTGEHRVYSKIALMPEIGIWKFGIGLDLYFYFDENNALRDDDWDDSSDWIDKIWYVRYGHKGEPLYAYCGGLKSTTIGHGLIMNNYTNMLRYPDVRKIGAMLDIDTGFIGIQSMVADINRADIFGGRLFIQPLRSYPLPLINRIAVGFSGVTDRNPDEQDTINDDEITVYGIDAEIPVFNNSLLSSLVYADAAQMDLGDHYTVQGSSDEGRGYAAGVMGTLLFISYRCEYRRYENNFIPSYFNVFYEQDRFDTATGTGKADQIARDTEPIREGPYGELGFSFLSLATLKARYEDYSHDTSMLYPLVHGELILDPRVLLNRFTVKASYDKRNVEHFKDLDDVAGAYITAEIGYQVSPGVYIVMIKRQTFDRAGNATETTEIETRIQF